MKAISLYEPWATLIALGKKRYETRSWSTTYRGPLLICASLKQLLLAQIIGILSRAGITMDELNPGRAVVLVDLVDIFRTEEILSFVPWENETYYGNFSWGRFAWKNREHPALCQSSLGKRKAKIILCR